MFGLESADELNFDLRRRKLAPQLSAHITKSRGGGNNGQEQWSRGAQVEQLVSCVRGANATRTMRDSEENKNMHAGKQEKGSIVGGNCVNIVTGLWAEKLALASLPRKVLYIAVNGLPRAGQGKHKNRTENNGLPHNSLFLEFLYFASINFMLVDYCN